MKWSQLRTRFLDTLAPELAGHLDAHSASYPSGGRTWITFDGKEIACVQAPGFTRQIYGHTICADLHKGQTLELGRAIFDLLHSSIDECLSSTNPLLKGVALLDKRCGKRRLQFIANTDSTLTSFEGALLACRMIALSQPYPAVICEHCGQTLLGAA